MRRGIRTPMKLPRVHRVIKGGKEHRYHRRTRKPLPNGIPEDDPVFVAAWLAEEQKAPQKPSRAAPDTVAAACEAYLVSRSYSDLKPAYRSVIRRHVDKISEQGAKAKLAHLRGKHIEADLEPLSPAVASSRLKAWRKLCDFWRRTGATATDLAHGVKRKRIDKTGGHEAWTDADLYAFRAYWSIGTPERTAVEILQWSGGRCVDAIRLGPQMVSADGVLTFTQKKTRKPAHVPWTCQAFGLEYQRADLEECIKDTRALVFMLTAYGKPRTQKGFSQWFAAAARKAGLVSKTAHGLRKYRMHKLAEARLSVTIMQAWVGHVTLEEVQEYTDSVNRQAIIAGTLGGKPRLAEA